MRNREPARDRLLNAAAELPLDDPGRAIVAWQKEEGQSLFTQF